MARTATWRNTPFAKKFYRSKSWLNVRDLVMARAGGLCERCLANDRLTAATLVHHTTPLTAENFNDPEVSLNPDRLQALCDDCHTEVHRALGIGALNGKAQEELRVGFDENGNVVRL